MPRAFLAPPHNSEFSLFCLSEHQEPGGRAHASAEFRRRSGSRAGPGLPAQEGSSA